VQKIVKSKHAIKTSGLPQNVTESISSGIVTDSNSRVRRKGMQLCLQKFRGLPTRPHSTAWYSINEWMKVQWFKVHTKTDQEST